MKLYMDADRGKQRTKKKAKNKKKKHKKTNTLEINAT